MLRLAHDGDDVVGTVGLIEGCRPFACRGEVDPQTGAQVECDRDDCKSGCRFDQYLLSSSSVYSVWARQAVQAATGKLNGFESAFVEGPNDGSGKRLYPETVPCSGAAFAPAANLSVQVFAYPKGNYERVPWSFSVQGTTGADGTIRFRGLWSTAAGVGNLCTGDVVLQTSVISPAKEWWTVDDDDRSGQGAEHYAVLEENSFLTVDGSLAPPRAANGWTADEAQAACGCNRDAALSLRLACGAVVQASQPPVSSCPGGMPSCNDPACKSCLDGCLHQAPYDCADQGANRPGCMLRCMLETGCDATCGRAWSGSPAPSAPLEQA